MKANIFLNFLVCTTTAFHNTLSSSQHQASFSSISKTTALGAAVSRRSVIETTLVGSIAFLSTAPVFAEKPPLPTYLSEPTDEFKANEAKAMEFKREQLAIKVQFNKVIERFNTQSKSEKDFIRDLNELQDLVIKTGGLPLGIKKDELYKNIRRKKSAGFWPTKVEYAYQALIREIAYQQNPNTEKDTANPL
mmetsp:Transcript_30758/g.35074  ORF Transcript_30758/g.35074 Transcript_30758/m.35074 type:complete len:192 (-) Transcript_30758:182-757(-)|eukprot:CAMPEP_0194138736 /NCGR_PEP_ID=MMETSP0152-20130528/8469_1 /TAXON_ID=1049557 /ORGANISM="Thalassiothrix antarctica, Strain L6-D1" /LENGTH=191 /DNA_ID=CAMNT_0038836281 /DNA_START=91 /DNA_END=666 /DNA_ORIENTATION=-